ncbi:LysE family translocator [Oxyplasma meridianum]|uniref:LysE family translocator n=1 Tax=Oxyplasma meridianum TaxID=3073602 RepID=A0AAX4NHH6_9ARCH
MITGVAIVLGISLGISLAAPPGPITAMIVDRSMTSVMKGFMIGMGAMSADFTLMIITLGFRSLVDLASYDSYIFLMGGIFFIFLSVGVFRSRYSDGIKSPRKNMNYFSGLLLGLVNPMQIAWWLTAGLSVFQRFGTEPFYFLFIGIVLWVAFLTLAINRSVVKYGKKMAEAIKIFSFIILASFGVVFIYYGINLFLK